MGGAWSLGIHVSAGSAILPFGSFFSSGWGIPKNRRGQSCGIKATRAKNDSHFFLTLSFLVSDANDIDTKEEGEEKDEDALSFPIHL